MKQLRAMLFVLLMVVSTAYAGLSAVNQPNGQKPLNVSFVQMSHFVTLTPVDVKTGMYNLTMADTSPFVTYFSDRPDRVAGQISMTDYLAKWNKGSDSFSKDAPNAILSGGSKLSSTKHRPVNVVMELLTPSFNTHTHVLTYRVHVLSGLDNNANKLVEVHNSTLIIDNACFSCS